MITAAILILFVLAVGFAVHHQSRRPSYPRPLLYGSAPFEDRDIARIVHDLQR